MSIRVTMSDGSEWDVPAGAVAIDRAMYFADKVTDLTEYRRVLDEEYNYTMTHDDELLDWAANNIDWSEVEKGANRVLPPSPLTPQEFQEGWMNGPKRVIRD